MKRKYQTTNRNEEEISDDGMSENEMSQGEKSHDEMSEDEISQSEKSQDDMIGSLNPLDAEYYTVSNVKCLRDYYRLMKGHARSTHFSKYSFKALQYHLKLYRHDKNVFLADEKNLKQCLMETYTAMPLDDVQKTEYELHNLYLRQKSGAEKRDQNFKELMRISRNLKNKVDQKFKYYVRRLFPDKAQSLTKARQIQRNEQRSKDCDVGESVPDDDESECESDDDLSDEDDVEDRPQKPASNLSEPATILLERSPSESPRAKKAVKKHNFYSKKDFTRIFSFEDRSPIPETTEQSTLILQSLTKCFDNIYPEIEKKNASMNVLIVIKFITFLGRTNPEERKFIIPMLESHVKYIRCT